MSYELQLADAHEYLKTLPDGSIDMVCVDPPYMTTALLYEQPLDWPAIWAELYRACKPSAQMVFFSAQPFTTQLINSNPKDFRLERIWVKSRKTGHLNSKWRPLQQHENILVFCRQPLLATYQPQPQPRTGEPIASVKRRPENHCRHYGGQTNAVTGWDDDGTRQPTTIAAYDSVQRSGNTHPSEKPLPLLRELLLTYSREGDTVLDFCAGSGSTGQACLGTGRSFKGCEIDASYHASATRRLDAVLAQGVLQFA